MSNIFTDKADLKAVLGGSINGSLQLDSIDPFIDVALDTHVLPFLPQTVIDEITGETGDATRKGLLKTAVGFLAVYEYAPVGNVQFSESGLVRLETDNQKTAYKYQENAFRDQMMSIGQNALEKLIISVYNDRGTLMTSGERLEYFENRFIWKSSDFRSLYSHYVSRNTFQVLRPLIEDVEKYAIENVIGKATADMLLSKSHDPAESDNTFLTAIHFIKKAIVNLSIEEGLRRHYVELSGNKIIIRERGDSQSFEYERMVNPNAAGLVMRNDHIMGNRYINSLTAHLTTYSDSFPDWTVPTEEDITTTDGNIIHF